MRVSRIFVAAPLFLAALLVSRPLAAQLPQSPARYQPAAFHPQPSGLLAPVTNIQPIEAPGAHFRTNEGPHTSQAVALMIVGAAGIVTGLLVDEDIITVAGAAAAGVGLYLYLR